ncbi:MAG: lactoylglutathione lyase [Halobacteriovoraceae bacterium]|nr:lactoylglutathione lyase [Halobacteriovoraceae bacterium]
MKFLHTMFRVKDLEKSLDFYINKLGLVETRRLEVPEGKFTLIYLATEEGAPEVELTYNWDSEEDYSQGRFFGHIAFEVENIYEKCSSLEKSGITINRPPRDGYMAFIKSPDGHSIELLQKGKALEPHSDWKDRESIGSW